MLPTHNITLNADLAAKGLALIQLMETAWIVEQTDVCEVVADRQPEHTSWLDYWTFVSLYIIATCGSLLISGLRTVVWFGLANFAVVIALAFLSADGFASLWCFYAAIVSGAIALHLRFGKQHPDRLDERQPSIA